MAGVSFSVTARPPITLPLPGSTWIVVTPPATARWICGSWVQKECSLNTYAVVGSVISLPSAVAPEPGAAYTPRWLCVSMSPGVTNFPRAWMTSASLGSSTWPAGPIATMRPPASTTVPSAMRVPSPTSSVAPTIATAGARAATVGVTASSGTRGFARPSMSGMGGLSSGGGLLAHAADSPAEAIHRRYLTAAHPTACARCRLLAVLVSPRGSARAPRATVT